MNAISTQIGKVVEAATALGAPKFSADWMHRTAIKIEGEIAAIVERDGILAAHTPDLDRDLETLRRGAEAALAFIASPFLPDKLAAYRDSEDGNGRITAAQSVCRRYGGYVLDPQKEASA